MTEWTIQILLICSIIISLFFFLNRSAFFSKLGLNSIQLVRLSERRNLHLIISILLLGYPITQVMIGNDSFRPLYGIAITIIIIILIFELVGFPGIFKAINDPKFIELSDLDDTLQTYLEVADVIGIEFDGVARAYPVEPLQMVHVVNDSINEHKFAVTHCALCNSSHVFNRIIDQHERTFHAAVPIIRSNLVLADEHGNLWQQLTGEGLAGNAVGHDLEIITSITTSWNNWKRLHPETVVLNYKHKRLLKLGNIWFSKLIKNIRNEDRVPIFPTGHTDIRYSPKAPIFGLIVKKKPVAFPLEKIPNKFQVNMRIDNVSIFVFYSHEHGMHGAFYTPSENGSGPLDLHFDFSEKEIIANSHRWDLVGNSLSSNVSLKPVKFTYPIYWFAWIGTYKDSLVIENIAEIDKTISITD